MLFPLHTRKINPVTQRIKQAICDPFTRYQFTIVLLIISLIVVTLGAREKIQAAEFHARFTESALAYQSAQLKMLQTRLESRERGVTIPPANRKALGVAVKSGISARQLHQ